ncbi:unnamed protein product [Hydatigera taeniaeformis]|uniref:SUN domain-containing protein n=1 Tax=Hydatigena taeniaeformis TaxID=6205 RepID=A0A0R3WIT1_HYDTA|nr:unnamed protein product [Hydatigera taeniaeformis]
MQDLVLSCRVIAATSNDERFPAKNVLNVNDNNFWLTTGIFPQCLLISLNSRTALKFLKIVSTCIKSFVVEAASDDASKYQTSVEMNADFADKQIQITNCPLNGALCKRIKITILSAYDHFVAVYKLIFEQG